MPARPKAGARPKKRTIQRWDDDLDQLLLITIHCVCGNNLPWAEVANAMSAIGYPTSKGAITQHLDKVRLRRQQDGKDVPPAPRRRGYENSTIKTARKAHATRGNCRENKPYDSDKDMVELRPIKRRNVISNGNKLDLDMDEEYIDDTDESDEELIPPGAKIFDLPNDRQRKRQQSSIPQTPTKIVRCKCPRAFLEQLGKGTPKNASRLTQPGLPASPVIKPEPVSESKPGLGLESNLESAAQITPGYNSVWGTFPEDPFVDSTSQFTGSDILSQQPNLFSNQFPFVDSTSQFTASNIPFQQPDLSSNQSTMAGMYIDTGNADIDLPPMSGIDPNSMELCGFPPLQNFQPDESVQESAQENVQQDQYFQDLLGEHFTQPNDLTFYGAEAWL